MGLEVSVNAGVELAVTRSGGIDVRIGVKLAAGVASGSTSRSAPV